MNDKVNNSFEHASNHRVAWEPIDNQKYHINIEETVESNFKWPTNTLLIASDSILNNIDEKDLINIILKLGSPFPWIYNIGYAQLFNSTFKANAW